jgi:hypothetical protein
MVAACRASYDDGMANDRPPRRTDGERHPLRRLSSIGGTTTGWRSTLESDPRGSLGTFVVGALIAGAVVAGLMFLAAVLGNL